MIGLAVVIGKAGRQDTVNFSKVCWRQNDVRGAGISAQVSPAAGAGYRDQLVAFGQNPGDCSGESGQATSGAEAAELVYFQRIGGKVRFCETRICVSNSVIWLRQSRIAQQVAGEQREGGEGHAKGFAGLVQAQFGLLRAKANIRSVSRRRGSHGRGAKCRGATSDMP